MRKILIVESDQSVTELYRYLFADMGYSVETAPTAGDGLFKAAACMPDCILIDVSLPEMTWDDFARKLCSHPDPAVRSIPFVVMTGDNFTTFSCPQEEPAFHPCRAFLPKVSNPDIVTATVSEILGAKAAPR